MKKRKKMMIRMLIMRMIMIMIMIKITTYCKARNGKERER